MQRKVVCAANKYVSADGSQVIIICGARHWDLLMRSQVEAFDEALWESVKLSEVQGFVDQHGVFLTREEAWIVAEQAGQIVLRCGGDGVRLYSENLY